MASTDNSRMRSAEEGAGRAIGIFFPARIAWTNRNKENIPLSIIRKQEKSGLNLGVFCSLNYRGSANPGSSGYVKSRKCLILSGFSDTCPSPPSFARFASLPRPIRWAPAALRFGTPCSRTGAVSDDSRPASAVAKGIHQQLAHENSPSVQQPDPSRDTPFKAEASPGTQGAGRCADRRLRLLLVGWLSIED
jgi:hypothetical protein